MLYFKTDTGVTQWLGTPIGDTSYPHTIEDLWSDQELAKLGLYRAQEPDPVPAGKITTGETVELVDGKVKRVYVLTDAPGPIFPSTNPSDYDLADWQLRKGLVYNGYSLEAIEATIKAIPDQAEREMRWLAWDRPAVIRWDSPTTQAFIAWLGIPSPYAVDMWLMAKDFTLTL